MAICKGKQCLNCIWILNPVIIFLICNATVPGLTSMYSGSWCPYQIHKSVPCRIQNGTESYLGPNLCWTSANGSYVCTKRIQYRPRFTTTYKKIWETRYKCCPGLYGPDCQIECFNCSKLHLMENRLVEFESKLRKLTSSSNYDSTVSLSSQWPITNTIEHSQLLSTSKNDLLDLEIRVAALSTNFSLCQLSLTQGPSNEQLLPSRSPNQVNPWNIHEELDDRLRSVETQLLQLIRSVDDLNKTLGEKTDMIAGNLKDNLSSTSSSTVKQSQIHHENLNQAAKVKSHGRPHSYHYNSISDYNQYSLSTQSLITTDLNGSGADISTSSTETLSFPPEQSTSASTDSNKDIIVDIPKTENPEKQKAVRSNKQKHPTRFPISTSK